MAKTLGISPVSGTVYYGNAAKDKQGREYWTSKTEIPDGVFIQVMMSFIKQRADENGHMTITKDGKPHVLITMIDVDTKPAKASVTQ